MKGLTSRTVIPNGMINLRIYGSWSLQADDLRWWCMYRQRPRGHAARSYSKMIFAILNSQMKKTRFLFAVLVLALLAGPRSYAQNAAPPPIDERAAAGDQPDDAGPLATG